MSRNEIFILSLMLCLLVACKTGDNSRLRIELKSVDFIYSRPDVLSNQDTNSNFKTYIFLGVRCLIKNPSSVNREVILNNLMLKDYSFDVKMDFTRKEIFFYNYPFSGSFFPVTNKLDIKAYDSNYIDLQTPLVFYFKKVNLNKIDSLFQALRQSKFSLILNKIQDAEFLIDSNKIKYSLLPISDKCFLSMPE